MFGNKFVKHDDYYTPKSAWENIKEYIPKNMDIWEAFSGPGCNSAEFLRELGFNVISDDEDFFKNNKGDIIVSNPPFSKKQKIIPKLFELNKPWIMIMPQAVLNTVYLQKLLKLHSNKGKIQVIVPKKRIHFMKMVDGVADYNQKSSCNFDCFYYCWGINLENDITFL